MADDKTEETKTEETEKTEEETEEKTEGLSFETADELSTFLMDLQGQIGNLQKTIDKMNPVSEEEKTEETSEEKTEETSEEELSEIDQLLQTK